MGSSWRKQESRYPGRTPEEMPEGLMKKSRKDLLMDFRKEFLEESGNKFQGSVEESQKKLLM